MASVLISSFLKGAADWLSLNFSTPSTSWTTTTSLADDLKKLTKMFDRIKAVLLDAEKRDIIDVSVKLWLKEIKDVAFDAEDLLDEYHYHVLRAQVEDEATAEASRKRKHVEGVEEEVITLASSSASKIAVSKISILSNMAGRIKKIRETLDEISKFRHDLHLKPEDGKIRHDDNSSEYPHQTSHMIVEQIYGREHDKEKLIEWLFSNKESKFEVLAVVGKGGLGKTTLARLVYNNSKVTDYFQQKMWVCVSNDFNLIKLTRALIGSITKQSCTLSDQLSPLQESLQKELTGKRVLLVLDDVWNDNKGLWNSLSIPFHGAAFVRIIVTARNDSVAEAMQTTAPCRLGHLSEEQCWLLFMRIAFCGRDPEKFPWLVDIGKKIVKKCDGLPLAVKSLGGLLQGDRWNDDSWDDEDRWNDVLHSKLWDNETEILPALLLSYIRMPSHLKPCFEICSMFPKHYKFDKDELVKFWAAHGYIQHNGEENAVKKIGYMYFNELRRRSFFDEFDEYWDKIYKMHDNIHDLAHYVQMELTDFNIHNKHKIRHLSIRENESLKSYLNNIEALRTLILVQKNSIAINDMLQRTIRRLTHLRYLHIKLYKYTSDQLELLLEGIGNLICLRHFELYVGAKMKLPKSIGGMYNLVVLVINCHGLVELPETFKNLVSLTTINFCNFQNDQLPALGQLPSLRSLTINHFDSLKTIGNEFYRGRNNRHHVAFPSLTSLVLWYLPNWEKWDELQKGDFPRLQKLKIGMCEKLSSLPSLQNLGLLSHMSLRTCDLLQLSSVDLFPPNLKSLKNSGDLKLSLPQGFGEMKKLERLRGIVGVRIDEVHEILKNLVRLKCLILQNAENVRKYNGDELFHEQAEVLNLVVETSHKGSHLSDSKDASFSLLPKTWINLVSLTTIYFRGFHIDQLPALGLLPSLMSLTLIKLDDVKRIGNEFYRGVGNNHHCVAFPSLTSLIFQELTNWEKWDELQEGDFPQLQMLEINCCPSLSSLPSLGNLMLLSHISLWECDSLRISAEVSFPPNLKTLENLGTLKLCLPQGFGELKKLERLSGTFRVRIDMVFAILKKLVSLKYLILSELQNACSAWNDEACLREYSGIEKLVLNWSFTDEIDFHEISCFSLEEDLHLVVEEDDDDEIEKDDSEDDDDFISGSDGTVSFLDKLQPRTNLEEDDDDEIEKDDSKDDDGFISGSDGTVSFLDKLQPRTNLEEDDDDEIEKDDSEDDDDFISGSDGTVSFFVLDKLQPRTNLEELYIIGYYGVGVGYPSWIGHPSFDRLNVVHLLSCKVEQLPTLGRLPSLEHLHVYSIYRLKRIDDEFCRGINNNGHSDDAVAFPALIKLEFEEMYRWEEWDGVRQGDFPKLESLSIYYCPRLSSLPVLPNLCTNFDFSIRECPGINILVEGSLPPNMKTLRYTNFDSVERSIFLSPGAKLLKLESLEGMFWVRNDQLFEILNNLPVKTDKLTITALRNVRSFMEAEVNLKSQQGLGFLRLKWSTDVAPCDAYNTLCLVVEEDDNDDDDGTNQTENANFFLLEKLQAHVNLRELKIEGYDGAGYPSWIGHPSFSRLTEICLRNCNSDKLPTLGQLPSLDMLSLDSIFILKKIGDEFCRGTMMNNDHDNINAAFPSLRYLTFRHMHDWEKWHGVLEQDFPKLERLTIDDCPSLHRDMISLPQRLLELIYTH